MKICTAPAGVAALAELVARYEKHADLHVPLRVVVVDNPMVNAFALPGGYIYMMRGLIQKARGPDEVAGVLGHEIGHVKFRHGLQSAIQSGGLGFLLGTVFGDFAGGTAILLASRALLSSAFSREAERQADAFGVDLMLKGGGNPEGLAGFFGTAGGGPPGALNWLTSHPSERRARGRHPAAGAEPPGAGAGADARRSGRRCAPSARRPAEAASPMRRAPLVEPISRLAVWSLRLTLAGLAVMLVAVVAARSDWLDGLQAVVALAIGVGVAGLGLLAASGGRRDHLGDGLSRRAPGGSGGAARPRGDGLSGDAGGRSAGGCRPWPTSRPTSPTRPASVIAAMARPPTANPIAYAARLAPIAAPALSRRSGPIEVDLPAESVNTIVSDLVEERRWTVLDQVDYRGPDREGRVEMVTRSLLLGFRDDIVIRIRSVNGRSRIDMRSASRYGRQDFGVNARRVIAALDEMRAAARRAQRER
jgi:hypothetical protein